MNFSPSKKNEVFEAKNADYWRARLAADDHDVRYLWRCLCQEVFGFVIQCLKVDTDRTATAVSFRAGSAEVGYSQATC